MALVARTQQNQAAPALEPGRLRLNLARIVLGAATLAWLADAVLEHPTPLVMAVGVVPLAWIALEAVWCLTGDRDRTDG